LTRPLGAACLGCVKQYSRDAGRAFAARLFVGSEADRQFIGHMPGNRHRRPSAQPEPGNGREPEKCGMADRCAGNNEGDFRRDNLIGRDRQKNDHQSIMPRGRRSMERRVRGAVFPSRAAAAGFVLAERIGGRSSRSGVGNGHLDAQTNYSRATEIGSCGVDNLRPMPAQGRGSAVA